MIYASDARPALLVAAPATDLSRQASQSLISKPARALAILQGDDWGLRSPRISNGLTIAQLPKQVYYVNKYAILFSREFSVGLCCQTMKCAGYQLTKDRSMPRSENTSRGSTVSLTIPATSSCRKRLLRMRRATKSFSHGRENQFSAIR